MTVGASLRVLLRVPPCVFQRDERPKNKGNGETNKERESGEKENNARKKQNRKVMQKKRTERGDRKRERRNNWRDMEVRDRVHKFFYGWHCT